MIRHKAKSGFTLVELLVVIAIIGILVALLLPAIQAAREAARRSSCTNNLKNLGLGVLNHHDVLKHFPVNMGAYLAGEAPPGVTQSGASWILNALPQLEEQSLYDKFKAGGAFEGNFVANLCPAVKVGDNKPNKGLDSAKNGISVPELMKTKLSVLQCPSDASAAQLSKDEWQFKNCDVAVSSYKGVLDDSFANELGGGTFWNNVPGQEQFWSGRYDDRPPPGTSQNDCSRDTRCRGIFFRQSFQKPVTIAKITDGTSKTTMIGEDVPELNWHSTAFYSNGTWCSCNAPLNYGLTQNPTTFPNDFWFDAQGFRSRHPGGVHFCFADGSVRFIAETVDSITFRISCTRNGDESYSGSL
jgi:prepilin-type N-terminal cleavage/methylation domain-containing protein/prepilin-type processing-associated H-X9-DG protein